MTLRIARLSILIVLVGVVRSVVAADEKAAEEPRRVVKTNRQWAAELTHAQFLVTRLKGTEPAFSGKYVNNHGHGVYQCVCCGAPLFSSGTKFESGTGWPSFWKPIDPSRVATAPDHSEAVPRVEVTCSRCDAHLGHVFDDGPPPTGLRFCMNSVALKFVPEPKAKATAKPVAKPKVKKPSVRAVDPTPGKGEEKGANVGGTDQAATALVKTEKATFGGGCFWSIEAVFERIRGVRSVVSGYAGGTVRAPTYGMVGTGTTGHAEVVQVEFDPEAVTYETLLKVFWAAHDPTTWNRQGDDFGPQYRSIILYRNEAQERAALKSYRELTTQHVFDRPIVTELVPLRNFYRAEGYHQDYFRRHRASEYSQNYIVPKLKHLNLI